MASGRVVYSNNPNTMAALLQNDGALSSSSSGSPLLKPFWMNSSDPTFHGVSSMVCFDDPRCRDGVNGQFFQPMIKEEACGEDEEYDDFTQQPGKKRRLTADQVQNLERSFSVENKLEPERKLQLAKELGLQPRQVAIWFQNRRARSKTKQLEKDFGSLKARYDTLKVDHDNLLKEKEKLTSEVLSLTDKLQVRERGKGRSESGEPICSSHGGPVENPIPEKSLVTVCKQEDAISSAMSDLVDGDSPQYLQNHNQSPMMEPADSSHGFEPDHSDFSQDEEDELSHTLLPPIPYFPKFETLDYSSCHDSVPAENPCNFGFTVDDQPFCFWPY